MQARIADKTFCSWIYPITGKQCIWGAIENSSYCSEHQPVFSKQQCPHYWDNLNICSLEEGHTGDHKWMLKPVDLVNHPPHYHVGKFEVIDIIEDLNLNYHLSCVIKYIARAEHKGNPLQDLKKARWYLDREIVNREKADTQRNNTRPNQDPKDLPSSS